MQVVSVAECDLRINASEIVSGKAAFNGARGRDVHKNRGLDRSVHGFHVRSLCPALSLYHFIFHLCHAD
jgi:hypothetical protein